MNVEKAVKRWVDAQIISKEQAERIFAFEREHVSASWVLFGLCGLGVTVVLTGVVSIIAANWTAISATTKLISYFVSLGVLGWITSRYRLRPGAVRESFLTAFALYVLAGIGLIGQIYHLESDGYQALFFWLVIVLPITLAAESRLVNNLWFVVLGIAVSLWCAASTFSDATRIFTAIAVPYVLIGFGYALHHLLSPFFCTAARFWGYVTVLLSFTIWGNALWASGARIFEPVEIGNSWLIAIAGVLISLVGASFRRVQRGAFLTAAIATVIVGSTALVILPLVVHLGQHDIFGCVLFIFTWAGAATIAAAIQRKRLFDIAALVIGIRFIVVYFEVFGSLAATGIGLILSGGVILGIAYLWHRYRGKVARVIQEKI